MLRILILIECDVCNSVLNEIAVARDDRRAYSDDADERLDGKIHDLQLSAEAYGWQSMKDSTVHHCSDCLRS